MKQLLETIVKALVDSPDKVEILENPVDNVTVLEIRVAQEDVGKVIGKEGRIANSIRTVMKASAAKQEKKVSVEIIAKQLSTTETPYPIVA